MSGVLTPSVGRRAPRDRRSGSKEPPGGHRPPVPPARLHSPQLCLASCSVLLCRHFWPGPGARASRRHRLGSGGAPSARLSLTAGSGSAAQLLAGGGRGARGPGQGQGPWAGPGSRVLTVGGAPVGRLQVPAPELPSPSPQGAHWPPELSETHDRRPVFFLKYASYSPPQTLAEPLGAPDIRPVAAPAAVGCARGPPGSLPPAQDQPLCPKERVSRGHRPALGFKCMSVSRWPRRMMPTAPRAGPVQRHCVTCSPAGADGTVQIVSRWRGLLGRAS